VLLGFTYLKEIIMTLDDIKREFASQVKLRGFDDKYIDKAEEKEIIQMAIAKGISFESARASLQQVCEKEGYMLESGVMKEAKNLLEVQAGSGKIDLRDFTDAIEFVKRRINGVRSDKQIKRMLCEMIDEEALRTTCGWLTNWFKSIKRSVGIN
jgi:hypothetical protein